MSFGQAISGGLSFIQAQQVEEGYWADWQLPPGESRMWTTAYIGYRLATFGELSSNLQRAAHWLRNRGFPNGGWGYSDDTGPDADTTSFAVFFLHSQGLSVSESDLRRLRAFQQLDGGFSTYTAETSYGSWVCSHPDVTPVALLALLSASSGKVGELDGGLRYVQAQRREDGLWNSFWWVSRLYATEASLALLRFAGLPFATDHLISTLREYQPSNAFESALLLLCLIRAGRAAARVAMETASTLQSSQHPDGSWASAPILRLTHRSINEPWNTREAGPLFSDQHRLFTTATVVAALAAFRSGQ